MTVRAAVHARVPRTLQAHTHRARAHAAAGGAGRSYRRARAHRRAMATTRSRVRDGKGAPSYMCVQASVGGGRGGMGWRVSIAERARAAAPPHGDRSPARAAMNARTHCCCAPRAMLIAGQLEHRGHQSFSHCAVARLEDRALDRLRAVCPLCRYLAAAALSHGLCELRLDGLSGSPTASYQGRIATDYVLAPIRSRAHAYSGMERGDGVRLSAAPTAAGRCDS